MKKLSEYITHQQYSKQIDEMVKAINGEQFDESVFENSTEKSFGDILFAAVSLSSPVNESESKTIFDYIRDAQHGVEVDEGVIGAAVGTLVGATLGPRLGQAMCNVLGITKGPLYDLLCSRLVTTAIALKLGMRA